MDGLHLALFTGVERDLELAQYRILSGLQQVRQAFARNCVYPYLSNLIELYGTLQGVLDQSRDVSSRIGRRIKSIDWEQKRIVYEQGAVPDDPALFFGDLIEWSLPLIRSAIEEGQTLCEFFDGYLNIEAVGIIPAYTDEGYLLIPDEEHAVLHVIRYTVSIFTGADEQYRSLKTSLLESIPQRLVHLSPNTIKLRLVEQNTDLPNPATFLFSTEVAAPFDQTLLPIAKRKLLRQIST